LTKYYKRDEHVGLLFTKEVGGKSPKRDDRTRIEGSVLEVANVGILRVELGDPAVKSVKLIGSQALYGAISSISGVRRHNGQSSAQSKKNVLLDF